MRQTKEMLQRQNDALRRELIRQRQLVAAEREKTKQGTEEMRRALDIILALACLQYGERTENGAALTLSTADMQEAARYVVSSERGKGTYIIRAVKGKS